MLCRICI